MFFLICKWMVLIDSSLERELERLEGTKLIRDEEIIPFSYPGFPREATWLPPFPFEKAPGSPEEIPPCSDFWTQFLFERYRGIDEMMAIVNARPSYPSSIKGGHVVGVALENAFYHGNKNDPQLPVGVKVFEGSKGVLVRVKDAGSGFDYKRKEEQVREIAKKKLPIYLKPDEIPGGLKYFLRRGGGFYMYHVCPSKVFFEEGGSVVNIVFEDGIDIAEDLRLQREE